MVMEGLSSSLRDTLKKLARANRIDEKTLNEVVRDIQRALLSADVNVALVQQLSKRIKERALKEELSGKLNPRQHVINIVYQELVALLGEPITVPLTHHTVILVGLQGSGKTTTTVKLARFFQKKGLKAAVVCADTFRPGAYDQLSQLCARIGVPFYGELGNKNAVEITDHGIAELKRYDVVLVDTAGRHALESDLVLEMKAINDIAHADQRFLVLDSGIGQQASEQARAFNAAIGITGVIVTKLDGTAKGGGALSAVAEVGTGIAFIGTGETIDDFEKFEPDRFISRLLGMGDIKTLVEMIEDEPPIEMEEAEAMLKGDFTLKDMYKQMEAIGKMGPLAKIVQMLPLGSLGVDIPDAALQSTKESLERFKIVMDSMTDEELEHPRIIRSSRIKRIARGSGVPTDNVRELLKYHKVMQRTLKGVRSQKDMQKFLRKQGLK
ncbi:MAG: signal recognition particle protein Srp54 [Euryarchaeota archaeon]|nr:signal recognition particle protein Srp54 [Euryarchaeota archaeon]